MSKTLFSKEIKSLRKFDADILWFQKNYDELKKNHRGEYVAVKNKKLVGHNENIFKLISDLRKEYPDLSSVVIEYISKEKTEYIL